MQPQRGDVVRSTDPFKLGKQRHRPWLVVNDESHPFGEEQHVAVAISTNGYDESVELTDDVWEVGGVPERSFVAPWAIHSPRGEDLVAWQGRVAAGFVDRIVEQACGYLGVTI